MSKPALPELNAGMILNLIEWAEYSSRRDAALAERFPNWGRWDQSNWASLTNDSPQPVRVNALPRVPTDEEGGVCRTSYCMAGQAAVQSDYRLIYANTVIDGRATVFAERGVPQRFSGRVSVKGYPIWEDVPGAAVVGIEQIGATVLGLTPEEADVFFGGSNSLEDLKQMANLFIYHRGLPPLFPDARMWDDDEYDEDDDRFGYEDYARPQPRPHIAQATSVPV